MRWNGLATRASVSAPRATESGDAGTACALAPAANQRVVRRKSPRARSPVAARSGGTRGGKSGEAGLVTARGLLADHALGNRSVEHGDSRAIGGFRLRLVSRFAYGAQSRPHPAAEPDAAVAAPVAGDDT